MIETTIQIITSIKSIPKPVILKRWIKTVLENHVKRAEITLRIVDKEESASLNSTYRHKNKPTNVLSFPLEEENEDNPLLGDIVICAPIVLEEAKSQQKSIEAHWAHLVVHGTLHLLGYDHIKDKDADIMEALEIEILEKLGFPNPYQDEEEII